MKITTILSLCIMFFMIAAIEAEENIAMFDSPVNPETYLLRPGDSLLVTFLQSQIKPLTLVIAPEGNIVDKTIGLFQFQNKTLAFAKIELIASLKKLYNVKNIEVSITTPRQVSIVVHGAVENPGRYNAMTSDRVSDIIQKAGGVLEHGSTRNILFYGGKNSIDVDLDKAIFQGDFNADPFLYSGTTIEVPSKSENSVHLSGDINFPREIELKEGDNLELLITLAGKFKNSATLSDLKIIRGNTVIDNTVIQAGDILMVKSKSNYNKNEVKLFGGVAKQGIYVYQKGMTVNNLIASAGGYSKTANKELTTIFRQPTINSHGESAHIRYPVSIPFHSTGTTDFILEQNDSIFVPLQVGFVKISGAVLNPGYFPYYPQKSILYYINSAGGFLPTSNKDEIQIFNQISEMTIIVSSGVVVPDGAEIIIQIKEELK